MNRISKPIEIEPCNSGEKLMYILRILFLSLNFLKKIFARTPWKRLCVYAKFITEIHLFMVCKKQKR
jgi:hypothetical protein